MAKAKVKDAVKTSKKLKPEERRANAVGVDPRRDARRARALEREAARAARTIEDQLAILDARPGSSARERALLGR